jgi:hypothetical protein
MFVPLVVVDAQNTLTSEVLAQCDTREAFKQLFTKVDESSVFIIIIFTLPAQASQWAARVCSSSSVCNANLSCKLRSK